MNRFILGQRLPMSVAIALVLLSGCWARATECFVLSAGVDNYPHVGKLQGCINDARNTAAVFNSQSGKMFTKVHVETIVDGAATHGRIVQELTEMSRKGRAGDYMILFLSGHGGRTADQQGWYFLPYDYNAQKHGTTALTDRQILDAADVLVKQGKKVVVIVDACFAGQLNVTARPYLQKYRNTKGGGMILMLSSGASQTSMALGQYSAFAKAFADSMSAGDQNGDGSVSVQEIRGYSYQRTHQLIKDKGLNAKQDSEVAWSPSISENTPLAVLRVNSTPQPVPPVVTDNRPQPLPQLNAQVWNGSEDLAGFGRLSFQLHANGRAIMHDTAGKSEGVWSQTGNQVTIRFSGGRVIYTGTLHGGTLTGTARNDRTSWHFSLYNAVNVRN